MQLFWFRNSVFFNYSIFQDMFQQDCDSPPNHMVLSFLQYQGGLALDDDNPFAPYLVS